MAQIGFKVGGSDGGGADIGDLLVAREFFTEGGLFTWGLNANGQLGTNDIVHRSTPVQTTAGGANWKQVACGVDHSLAVKTDGTLWCWGLNGNGQLGVNDTTQRNTPVQTISGGTNWKQCDGGTTHSSAVKTDGTLWSWGRNIYGQLGDNTSTQRNTPVQAIGGANTYWKQVTCGYGYTASIKTDGTLWTWGDNSFGQLGINNTALRSTPVQTTAGGTNWKQVAGGANHISAITTDGTLWCWGYNGYGQLGTNDSTNRSTPAQTSVGGTNWKQVGCGANHSLAIKTDGTLWTWGTNINGQLGTNNRSNRSTPTQTSVGGTNWKQVAGGVNHSLAVKTDGTLWTWGLNTNGQLGTNDIVHRSTPVQTTAGGTNWKTVAKGGNQSISIKDDIS